MPWITPADLTGYEDTYIAGGRRNLSSKGLASSGATLMPAGAVLFSSRAPIGYCAIAASPISTNQGFKSLVLHNGAVPEFIRYYLLSSKEYAEGLASGTTFKELSGARMAMLLVPLAPEKEQRRIVDKLDSLTGSSKNARDDLERIPKLVERYKQAVLAAAFRGDLTTDWRESNHVDAHLFLNEGGIATLQQQQASSLPRGWAWVAAGSLCAIKGGITLGKKRAPGTALVELPYLRVANVQRGWLSLDEIKTVSVTQKEAEALYLEPGDVLMNEGGDRDKLGRGWVWEGQIPNCIHQNHVFRLRPRTKGIPGNYISYYANEFGQRYFVDEGKQTTNLASISLSKISALPIPVAPPAEMAIIVQRIKNFFSRIDKLTTDTTHAMALLDRLDEALLGKAFRGELVSQHDEKALERESVLG